MATLAAVAADGLFRSGVVGVGQTALATDTTLAQNITNQMINEWTNERVVTVTPGNLLTFPDTTTDVPFWTQFQDTLTWNLACRLRTAYQLPPMPDMLQEAQKGLAILQANNKQAQAAYGFTLTTVEDLLYLALRLADRITDQQGVASGSQDMATALFLLQLMLADWNTRRWLVPCLQEQIIQATGSPNYALPVRVDRIESAFARLLPLAAAGQNIDYPLEVIQAQENYNQIYLKGLTTWPSYIYYDGGFPIGQIWLWPIPQQGQYEIHIWTKQTLAAVTGLTQVLGGLVPPVYLQAIAYNLAVRFPRADGKQLRPDVVALARQGLDTVRGSNLQVPLLRMPQDLRFGRRGTDWLFGGAGGSAPGSGNTGGSVLPGGGGLGDVGLGDQALGDSGIVGVGG